MHVARPFAVPAAALLVGLALSAVAVGQTSAHAEADRVLGQRPVSPVVEVLAEAHGHHARSSLAGTVAPATAGYNKSSAVGYANQWTGRTPTTPRHNPNFPYFSSDCTNFVSQTLAAGGWPETSSSGSQTDSHNWFFSPGFLTDQWTHSWTVAYNLWQYMVFTPNSSFQGLYYGAQMFNVFTPAAVTEGDVIEYDWYSNGNHNNGDDHWAVQVGYIANERNTVDSHTTDRYNVIWNLTPWNPNWQTTTARFWHVYN